MDDFGFDVDRDCMVSFLLAFGEVAETSCKRLAELGAYAGGIRTDCDKVIRNSER